MREREATHVVVQELVFLVYHEQLAQLLTVWESFVLAAFATSLLALDDSVDETGHHVKLSPMDLAGVVIMIVGVSLVCANKVGKVDFPNTKDVSGLKREQPRRVTHSAGIHAPFVLRSAIRYF